MPTIEKKLHWKEHNDSNRTVRCLQRVCLVVLLATTQKNQNKRKTVGLFACILFACFSLWSLKIASLLYISQATFCKRTRFVCCFVFFAPQSTMCFVTQPKHTRYNSSNQLKPQNTAIVLPKYGGSYCCFYFVFSVVFIVCCEAPKQMKLENKK